MAVSVDPTTLAVIPAVIAAMGVVIKMVLTALKEQREGFEKFLVTNLAETTRTLTNLAVHTESLSRGVDQLHEDNVVMAKTLKQSDKATTRKVSEQNMDSVARRVKALEDKDADPPL